MTPHDAKAALGSALVRSDGVGLAILFGSTARGSAGPASDVDVAVGAPGVDLLALAGELTSALEREVHVVDLGREVGVPLLEELLRDGIVVHERTPGAGAAWRARAWTTLETDRPWFERMRDAFLARLRGQAPTDGEPEPPHREAR